MDNILLKKIRIEQALLDYGLTDVWILSWNKKINKVLRGEYIVLTEEPNKEELEEMRKILMEQMELIEKKFNN